MGWTKPPAARNSTLPHQESSTNRSSSDAALAQWMVGSTSGWLFPQQRPRAVQFSSHFAWSLCAWTKRQQQEAGRRMARALRPINCNAPARRWRCVAVAVQFGCPAAKAMPLSRKICAAALGSGSAARPTPVRGGALARDGSYSKSCDLGADERRNLFIRPARGRGTRRFEQLSALRCARRVGPPQPRAARPDACRAAPGRKTARTTAARERRR